ncbi:MAG: TIGR01212 family radical SAM protein [Spirochaetales bacterium]|nr:TIGR01212 family radical SAM protein [Spirochaetales bacterium]
MKGFSSYSSWLESRYGAKTYRVPVDAGFSCPNRGPERETGGCSFCGNSGARAPYLAADTAACREASIAAQIQGGIAFLRKRYNARCFLLYFQAFTGTYAPAAELKRLYDYALSLADFRQLIVSTRPDCVDQEKAALLADYRNPGREVWVELGLQSAQEKTLRRIRRGHGLAEFQEAFSILRGHGIKIAVHLIFGLPGENTREIETTLKYLAQLKPEGVKIHNLHIPHGTPLAREFLAGELSLPCAARHIQYILRAREILPPQTLFMRYICDTPPGGLAYPRHFPEKARFLHELDAEALRACSEFHL